METAFGGVYLDHHVPDGAVICLVSAAPAPADIGYTLLKHSVVLKYLTVGTKISDGRVRP